jgi:hypothetical protein
MRNIETGRNSSCTSVWTLLFHVSNVFLFLHISLYLTFRMVVCTCKGALFPQVLVNTSEYMSVMVCGGYYRCPYSSTAALMLPLWNPYTEYISKYSSWVNGMFTVTSYCVLLTAWSDCTVSYLMYYCHCYDYINESTPAFIPYSSAATSLVTVVNQTHVYVTFLSQDCLWN